MKRSQRGQAIVEYLLLILIALTVLMGSLYQFNSAFKLYADAYFVGEESYLACLIKNGLLPGASEADDVCPKPQFNIAQGRPLAGQGVTAGAQNSKANQNSNNPATASNAGGSGGATGSRMRAGESRTGQIPMSSSASASGSQGKNASPSEKDKNATGNEGYSTSVGGADPWSTSSAKQSRAQRGRRKQALNEIEIESPEKVKSIPATEQDVKGSREVAFEKSKRQKKAIEESGVDLSFGNIFKYLLIAVLVFSIIFFLGSQLVAVSRSQKRK